MKGEKSKIILVYVLMLLVIGLIVALTLFVLNSNKKEENHSPSTNNAPKVDVNPFPNISQECTFNLTLDEYNALTGPRCKNGYSRYNVNGLSLGGKTMNVSVVYTDQDGNKAGIYVNDRRATTVVNNVINIKFGIFDDKLFILDNNNETNVLVFANDSTKVYDLKEALESSKITDPTLNQVLSSTTINPNSFNFTDANFTFQAGITRDNQTLAGSTYQVTFKGNEFSKPEFLTQN